MNTQNYFKEMKTRKIIMMLLALSILSGCAGMKPLTEEQKTIQRVVVVEGVTKDVIFEGVKMWIAENFRSAKAVLEYQDKESGRIIGNGKMDYPCSGIECVAKSDWDVLFTMRVDVKDGKFRLSFTNLQLSWPASYDSLGAHSAGLVPVSQQGDMESIKPVLLAYGDSIKKFIANPKNTKDW